MTLFSPDGICLFGTKSKGVHASKLNPSWVGWAKENVKGFDQAFEQALKAAPKTPRPKGRKYTLNRTRKFEPKGFAPPEGGGVDPDDAVDWEDDPGTGRYFEQA